MNNNDVRVDVRIDKWLWAARFFKIRSLATEAVRGGHIWLNGSRIKPSKSVQIGDEVTIQKGPQQFTVHISGLAEKRGSASTAQALYDETEASIAVRKKLAELRKFRAASAPAPDKRPDKKARRHIIRFKSNQD